MDTPHLTRKKFLASAFLALLLLAAVFGAGIFVGFEQRPGIKQLTGATEQETEKAANIDLSLFWRVWATLQSKYVDKNNINAQSEVYGAIAGMVKSLGDPYTIFLPPAETKQFQQDLQGAFGGIGAELGVRKGTVTVIAPLKDSPAAHAGLKPGDMIVKVDETATADLSLEEVVQLIRGEKGTPVKLFILRDTFTEPKEFDIVRDTIAVPTVETKKLPDGIFIIHLFSFNESAPQEFRNAVGEFLRSGSTKLILDLRGNPGGFLSGAVDIGSWFLPAGDVIAREHYADGSEDVYRSIGRDLLERTPVVVLIDQGSASAAEILAGALRDDRHIALIGEKSFGKGSVQELVDFPDGASLKVTIAKWLTPSGKTIQGEGLAPDLTVEITQDDANAGRDPQLDKAVAALKTR